MKKILMINENTVIKLYDQFRWECGTATHEEIITKVIDEIIIKLSKAKHEHPIKDLFLSEEDHGPYYELIHFTFNTLNSHVKMKRINNET